MASRKNQKSPGGFILVALIFAFLFARQALSPPKPKPEMPYPPLPEFQFEEPEADPAPAIAAASTSEPASVPSFTDSSRRRSHAPAEYFEGSPPPILAAPPALRTTRDEVTTQQAAPIRRNTMTFPATPPPHGSLPKRNTLWRNPADAPPPPIAAKPRRPRLREPRFQPERSVSDTVRERFWNLFREAERAEARGERARASLHLHQAERMFQNGGELDSSWPTGETTVARARMKDLADRLSRHGAETVTPL